MFNKTIQSTSKRFFIAAIFLALNFSSSWASSSTSKLPENNTPNLISQINDDALVQAADVTIKLEKKLAKASDWPNSIEDCSPVIGQTRLRLLPVIGQTP